MMIKNKITLSYFLHIADRTITVSSYALASIGSLFVIFSLLLSGAKLYILDRLADQGYYISEKVTVRYLKGDLIDIRIPSISKGKKRAYRVHILYSLLKYNKSRIHVDQLVVPYSVSKKSSSKVVNRLKDSTVDIDYLVVNTDKAQVTCKNTKFVDGKLSADSCSFFKYHTIFDLNKITKKHKIIYVDSVEVSNKFVNGYLFGFKYDKGKVKINSGFVNNEFGFVTFGNTVVDNNKVRLTNIDLSTKYTDSLNFKFVEADPHNKVITVDGIVVKLDKNKVAASFDCKDAALVLWNTKLPLYAKGDIRISITDKLHLSIKDRCVVRLKELPDYYFPYRPDGRTRFKRYLYFNWVYLGDINQSLIDSVIQYEDPGYWKHGPYVRLAYENSLKINVKKRRFVRGGSTIFMQLAKNLFLSRDKTITRKAKEFLLAKGLYTALDKEEALEWYLNIIEFEPNCYGIKCFCDRHGIDLYEMDDRIAKRIAKRIRNPKIAFTN